MGSRGARWWERLLEVVVVGLLGLSGLALARAAIRPDSWGLAGIKVDRLGASLGFLVASVGAVTFRFSKRYLDGDPGRRAFLTWLTITLVAAFVMMLADHLLLLLGSWSLTSLGLHAPLTHDPGRPESLRPARKKFVISRLGDASLLAAIVVIGKTWGTLGLADLLRVVAGPGPGHPVALGAAGVLIAVAALTKSAQFPFHSWLPETMEAPTPVSALMHAGIINGGGVLLLKFGPLIARVPAAMALLCAVGTLTLSLGLLAMWSQVKVKRTLAWSTVGQMGFMMVQCGLGAFPAAWLHMLGHGYYKAWSFLGSGGLPAPGRPSVAGSPARSLGLAGMGTALAVPALALSSRATGFSPWESPGELALAAIVALSIAQLWVALLGTPEPGGSWPWRGLGAVVGTFVAALGSFALYRAAGSFLTPALGQVARPEGPLAWASAVVPVAAMVALTVIHAWLPILGRRPEGRAFYVHALNGFYFGAIADRLVDRARDRLARARKGAQGA